MNKKEHTNLQIVMTYNTNYKSLLLIGFLVCFFTVINAQVNIQYEDFPTGGQLYQRDNLNKAIAASKGKVLDAGYSDVAILVQRDNKSYFWQKQKLKYETSMPIFANFSFETEIKAELSDYNFKLYLFSGKDSILVKQENQIVCGDVYLVYGQSNALADDVVEIQRFVGDNRFGRTVFEFLETGDYQWLPTQRNNYFSAGLLGLEVQKQLIDKYKIPIAIVNSSIGNKSIDELMIRDENNHANPAFFYGRMLKKAQTLGYAKKVKAIIWRQGEWEAYDAAYKNEYPKKFDTFRKQLLEDFPAIQKIYTYQNNIYFYGGQFSGNLREYQRTVKDIYPDCEVLATVGTLGFDGLHYSLEGYQQNGEEVSRLIARDFYQSTDINEISSPNIKKAFFTARKDSLILEFDANQKLTFPAPIKDKFDNATLNLKDYFYLDGKNVNVAKASSLNNFIILKFDQPQNATTVSYTPNFYTNDFLGFLPGLPPIKNSRGLRALTFKDFPVSNGNIVVSPTTLTGKLDNVSKKKIELNWANFNGENKTFTLEKAVNIPSFFAEIATLNTSQYIDYKVKRGIKYYYRLKIRQNSTNTITYSNTFELTIPFDTTNMILMNEDAVVVYPNPIQKGKDLKLEVVGDASISTIKLIDANNSIYHNVVEGLSENQFLINIDKLHSGMYFIEVLLNNNTKLIKKFVIE